MRDNKKASHLAEQFALGQVLSGDIPEDKTFDEILAELREGKNEDYELCELYENCFWGEEAATFIENLADDAHRLIADYENSLN